MKSSSFLRALLLPLGGAALAGGCLMAQESLKVQTVPPLVRNGVTVTVVNGPAGAKKSPAVLSAQKVHVDPSGKVRGGDQEESQQLSDSAKELIDRPLANLSVVTHPNGMSSVNLDGAFLSLATARVGADGKLTISCENAPPAGGAKKAQVAKEESNVR